MSNTLKVYSRQSNGILYCDPIAPDLTVRFKTTSAPKVVDGIRLTNIIREITANDKNIVAVGDSSAGDACSVRIRTSGSTQSVPRLVQMLKDITSKVEAWDSEDVFAGFDPVTAPINTAV